MLRDVFKDRTVFLEEFNEKLPLIYMMGQSALKIQNYKKILRYSSKEMLFLLDKQILSVQGEGLNLDYFDKDELGLHGHIQSITYRGG